MTNLDPSLSPDNPASGVVKLNRWPLVIVVGILVIALPALGYAVLQRGATPPAEIISNGSDSENLKVTVSSGDFSLDDLFPDDIIDLVVPAASPAHEPEPSRPVIQQTVTLTVPEKTKAEIEDAELLHAAIMSDTGVSHNTAASVPVGDGLPSLSVGVCGQEDAAALTALTALLDQIKTAEGTQGDPNLRARKASFRKTETLAISIQQSRGKNR